MRKLLVALVNHVYLYLGFGMFIVLAYYSAIWFLGVPPVSQGWLLGGLCIAGAWALYKIFGWRLWRIQVST